MIPANSRASIGSRPCSTRTNSVATSVRIRARTAAGTDQPAGSPSARFSCSNRWATATRNGETSLLWTLNGAPNRPAASATLVLNSASRIAASRSAANGCRPAPNSACICSAVTGSPAARPSIPSIPAPTHRPGDSPLAE